MRMRSFGPALALAFVGAAGAIAGGFWITVHSPASPLGAKTPNTAVLVEINGCANPSDARLTGSAEGLVSGHRQSLPLEFTPTSKPGVHAVKMQWPAEGVWVLVITGKAFGHTSSALVELGPDGHYRAEPARREQVTAARIEAALQNLASRFKAT